MADVDSWITVNGAHVPLDKEGNIMGGMGGNAKSILGGGGAGVAVAKPTQALIDKYKAEGLKGLAPDEQKIIRNTPLETIREMSNGKPAGYFSGKEQAMLDKGLHPDSPGVSGYVVKRGASGFKVMKNATPLKK